VNWIRLDQDRDRWRAIVISRWIYIDTCRSISMSRWIHTDISRSDNIDIPRSINIDMSRRFISKSYSNPAEISRMRQCGLDPRVSGEGWVAEFY
jgi:hypothetical protein